MMPETAPSRICDAGKATFPRWITHRRWWCPAVAAVAFACFLVAAWVISTADIASQALAAALTIASVVAVLAVANRLMQDRCRSCGTANGERVRRTRKST